MHQNKYRTLLFLCLILLGWQGIKAQNEISLPYSGFGVGVVNRSSNGILNGMGGVSYAMQNPYYINFRNPASYANFDSLSFVADVSASIYNSTLNTYESTQKNTYARPDYIAIGLPVTRHWRTSVGVVPFSTIGYHVVTTAQKEPMGNISYEYSSKGGLNQLYWGNAFRICKGLSLGLNASYMFGSIYNSSNVEFEEDNFYNTHISDAYNVDGIYLTGGIQYFFNIKQNHRIGLGAVYSNTAYIWAKEKILVNYYKNSYNDYNTYDTAYYDGNNKGNLHIPQSVGGGISYSYKDKITLAADVTWQNWTTFQFMGQGDSLQNSLSASLGAQYIPDPLSPKFLKHMAFRVGAKFSTGEFLLHNKPISEFGVTLGLGIPLTTFNTRSYINVAFEYGTMGTMVNDLIKQNYFRFTLNFTLQEKWYQRMKLE